MSARPKRRGDFRADRVREALVRAAPRMRRLAREIHRAPEHACREIHAASWLAGELEEEGFEVETGIGGLATALRAERRSGDGPRIAFLAEYDAIPGLGHAAGHDLVVAASFGAAVALAGELDGLSGSVALFGAPAEETIGGKVVLAARGAFDGLDAALLAHPGRFDRVRVRSLASWSFEVVFHGRSAHAVAAPQEGINALDAMIQLFVARDALLKSLRADVRLPGVILEGGVRPNLVPDRSRARFSLRAGDADYLVADVASRFRDVVQGVARATGTTASVTPIDNLYDELVTNEPLATLYERHAREAGSPLSEDGLAEPVGSLDVGTLSQRVPCVHPFFRIAKSADVVPYTREFARAAEAPEAHEAARRAATALALTGLDLLADPRALADVRAAHARIGRPRERPADAPLVAGPAGP